MGLLTGHTTLRAHAVQLGLTQWQDCRLRRDEKKYSEHLVSHCPALACKIYRTLGRIFLKPKDLYNMRGKGLISLAANTRLPYYLNLTLKQQGDTIELTKIFVSLGTIVKPLALFLLLILYNLLHALVIFEHFQVIYRDISCHYC